MLKRPLAILISLLLAALCSTPASMASPAESTPVSEDSGTSSDQPAIPPAASLPTEFDGVPLPMATSGDATIELVEKLLPSNFRRNRCSSHVVYTDSDWESLTQIRNVLTRSWIEYRNFCRRMDVVVPRPDEKLVCIVFNDHDDFLEFARKTEGDSAILEHAGGYFSPRYDWIVFYEPQHHQTAEQAHAQLQGQWKMIEQERSEIFLDELTAEEAQRIQSRWDWQDEQLKNAQENIEIWIEGQRTTVAVHESIHQFTHVCHTWPGKDQWPVWLHEGLATSFETKDANRGFGPDQLDMERDYQFINCLDQDQLMSLRDFLGRDNYGDESRETLSVLYPQSYGLLTWLYEYRQSDLAKFLKRLSAPPSEDGEDDPVVLFEEVFGNIDTLEKRWHSTEGRDWRTRRH